MLKLFKGFSQDRWAVIILFLAGFYLMLLNFLGGGLYGETDSVSHYQIARYAFQHPYLYLNHWGKPLFTLLSSPFAQFGMSGSVFFNVLCALFTGWMIYSAGRHLNYKYALAAIPFAIFAPVYMINTLTSLTEILFALVLVAGIYFFLKEKMILSAIIISFLPFVRMEGLMFIAIFLPAMILVKKYKAIPFLITGLAIYSLAGMNYYKDPLWFFNSNPYSEKGSNFYGNGSFWFYLERFHQLMGFPITILAVIGLIFIAKRAFSDKKITFSPAFLTEYYLVPVSLFSFILAHSFLWWKGMMAVLAAPRFMACIIPLGAFLALAGLNWINSYLSRRKNMDVIFTVVIILVTIWVPYTLHQIPSIVSNSDEVMKATSQAIIKKGCTKFPVYYFDPKLPFFLDMDPYAKGLYKDVPDRDNPDFSATDSTIVIWDAHFSEFDGKIRLDRLLFNPSFRLLDVFTPANDKKFATGQQYMSAIFQKVPQKNPEDQWKSVKFDGFESPQPGDKQQYYTDSVKYAGNYSYRIDTTHIYSPSLNAGFSELSPESKAVLLVRAKVMYEKETSPDKIILVMSVHDRQKEMTRYLTMNGAYFKSFPGQWFEMYMLNQVSTTIPEDGSVKVYMWFQGKSKIFVDDLSLEVLKMQQ